MAFTRVDCDFCCPSDRMGPPASYVALNPDRKPGSLVLAGSSATKKSLGAQVACKLSLDHFTEGVLDYFDTHDTPLTADTAVSQAVLEAAFKRANTSVYDFGHQLAAGGRLAASLIGVVIEDSVVAAGRVGDWSAYLLRNGILYPFFENPGEQSARRDASDDRFVGAKSLVTIETATVPVEASDIILIFSALLDDQLVRLLSLAVEDYADNALGSNWLSEQLFIDEPNPGIVLSATIGPDAIYLNNSLIE